MEVEWADGRKGQFSRRWGCTQRASSTKEKGLLRMERRVGKDMRRVGKDDEAEAVSIDGSVLCADTFIGHEASNK